MKEQIQIGAMTGLLLAFLMFTIAAYLSSRRMRTPAEFFHQTFRRGSTISMVIGNITLGTGLVYYSDLLKGGWLPALLPPIGVLIGYLTFAICAARSAYDPEREDNLYRFTLFAATAPKFGLATVTLYLVPVVFSLLIAFEVYASSPIIAILLGYEDTRYAVLYLSFLLTLVGVFYATMGGIRGVIFTDWIQFAFFLILIGTFGYIIYETRKTDGLATALLSTPFSYPHSVADLAALVSVFATAFSTQFYNIINVGLGSNFAPQTLRTIYVRAGVILSLCLLSMVIMGALLPLADGSGMRGAIQHIYAMEGMIGIVIAATAMIGMVGVLLSTVDSAVIHCGELTYEAFGGRSRSKETSKLWRAQVAVFIAAGVSIFGLILLIYFQPPLISLLFCILYPLTIIGLLMFGGLIGKVFGYQPILLGPGNQVIVSLALLALWLVSIFLTLIKDSESANLLTSITWLGCLVVILGELIAKGRSGVRSPHPSNGGRY